MANNQNDNLMTFGEHVAFPQDAFRIIAITICFDSRYFLFKGYYVSFIVGPV